MRHESPDSRLLRIIYVWLSVGVASAILAAKANVLRHDPWFTPRFTPDRLLYWGVARNVAPVLLPLAVVGVVLMCASSDLRRRWSMWLAVCLSVVALYQLFNT
jgi:hypothetical protein